MIKYKKNYIERTDIENMIVNYIGNYNIYVDDRTHLNYNCFVGKSVVELIEEIVSYSKDEEVVFVNGLSKRTIDSFKNWFNTYFGCLNFYWDKNNILRTNHKLVAEEDVKEYNEVLLKFD